MPIRLASTAAVPKISTGTHKGRTSSGIKTAAPRTPTVSAAPTAPIRLSKGVFKTFVYRLAEYRNTLGEVIPRNIITRAPSAELKPGQTDQDTLPPYAVLDSIIEAYMERDESPRQIIARGCPEADVRKVVGMLKKNEYKRRQAPVGIRVTQRGFGKDWRYPITSRYPDEF